MPDFQSGEYVRFVLGSTEYPVTRVKWTDGGPIHDHSNGRDGRLRTKGMDDFSGSGDMPLDLATARLRRGTTGTLKIYLSETQYDSIPVMITQAEHTGSLEDGYVVSAEWQQSGGDATIYDSAP